MTVRTRFAPSPTGHLHIGGIRTALYSWLEARRQGGQFILRVEDTDQERSTQASTEVILEGMHWLGLDPDEGPFFQSQRFDRYRQLTELLLDQGKAYHCWCSQDEVNQMREEQRRRGEKPRYDRRCRDNPNPRPGVEPVVRFRNPIDGSVVIDDLIKGRVVISNEEMDDLVIARGDGSPTYNFAVVVDDLDMKITHVIRGDDHFLNTPRQINIFHALDAPLPAFAHVPMILGDDGQKLSKRHGALSVLEYRREGFLPEAILNYLVRLGWSHGDQEIFSIEEMTSLFNIGAVNKAASAFNTEKLMWLNQHYIKSTPPEKLALLLKPLFEERGVDTSIGPALAEVAEANHERAKTLIEMVEKSGYLFEDFGEYDPKAAQKQLKAGIRQPLASLRQALAGLGPWEREPIHEVVTTVLEEFDLKFGKLAQPVRVALTGSTVSPPIDITLVLVGRQRSLDRLDRALAYIDGIESNS